MSQEREDRIEALAQGIAADIKKILEPSVIFSAVASTGNNIHGAAGTVLEVNWDASTNNAIEIDAFINGTDVIQALTSGVWKVHFSLAAIDNGVNNRSIYFPRLIHTDSIDVLKFDYVFTSMYLRDDNNTYDSGIMSGYVEIYVEAGDKINIASEVLEAQTTTGTVNLSTTLSKIIILK